MGPLLASTALRPVGPLGAAIVAGALVVMCAYLLGARERRRWGGRPPTAQEFLNSKHKMGRVQYSTAQWGPKVLVGASIILVVGGVLFAYGAFGT
ncbi:MAG TPA: hypothetical protein VG779_03555 [Actinomycetota bacterium]|jgi:hypothetical protein|nr:hypothetical protein [Actinomycetota bacterium]